MRKLDFIGTVQASTKEIIIPGREELIVKPAHWPKRLAPGVLNIGITGFPKGLEDIGNGEGLGRLDEGKFRAALVIPQRLIAGSTLKPDADHPTRGFAQVWQADLQVIATGQEMSCWAVRIIGSLSTSVLGLVAEEDLQTLLNLSDGMDVKVTVWEEESKWKPPTPGEVIADWCEAARGVEDDYGREKAMGYLIGEKLLNFLERAETDREWRQAIPTFVAEIRAMFERWQLAEFLNTPRRMGALGHTADDEGHRMLRESMEESERIQEDARNLTLLEWARELLLEEEGQ
jgi:hypothetical protein